jgi:hypothetical protein
MEELNINTPEFWEQVKKEYGPNARYICDISSTFKDAWGVKEIKRKIRRYAGEFVKTRKGDFDFMARMGDDQIIFNYFNLTRVQDIAVRRAFIEYMINLTRNATKN